VIRLLQAGCGLRRDASHRSGYLQLIQTFICQKKFELISRVLTPGRILDRDGKAIRCKRAGQYNGIDGAGTDVGGAVIVFRRFDDECHVGPTVGAAIVYRKAFSKKAFSKLQRNPVSYRLGACTALADLRTRRRDDLSEKITPLASRY
jgi:hypothetical protein